MKRTVQELLKVYDLVLDISFLAKKLELTYFSNGNSSAVKVELRRPTYTYPQEWYIWIDGNNHFKTSLNFQKIPFIPKLVHEQMSRDGVIEYCFRLTHSLQEYAMTIKTNLEFDELSMNSTDEEYFQRSLIYDYIFELSEYREFSAWIDTRPELLDYTLRHDYMDILRNCSNEYYQDIVDGLTESLLELTNETNRSRSTESI